MHTYLLSPFNRFATVVIYLTDVEEGGETVFPNGWVFFGDWLIG